jgi:uncharacterized protein YqjF (DUF2071 family)
MVSGGEPVTAEPPSRPRLAYLRVALIDVTFAHWPVPPESVQPLLPPGTRPDLWDGDAYVGVVAFRMRSFGEFLETNVRVYSVDDHGRRGVVFLIMEADRLPWVLAARAGGLPYAWARMGLVRNVHVLNYQSRRRWPPPSGLMNRMSVRVGPPVDATPFENFLTARWRFHLGLPGLTVTIPLSHDRWPLHSAELLSLDDQLIGAAGLHAPTTAPPSVLYAPRVDGRLGLPRPISSRTCLVS